MKRAIGPLWAAVWFRLESWPVRGQTRRARRLWIELQPVPNRAPGESHQQPRARYVANIESLEPDVTISRHRLRDLERHQFVHRLPAEPEYDHQFRGERVADHRPDQC